MVRPGRAADDGAAPEHSEGPAAGVIAGTARLRAAAQAGSTRGADADGEDPTWAEDDAGPDRAPRLGDSLRWRLPPRTAVVALAALALVGGAVAVRAASQPTGEPVAIEEPVVTATAGGPDSAGGGAADAADASPTGASTVWVHVVGQVASPGVVALPAGSRVGDAVAAAGGALPDADLAGLNLAAVVQDGAQIRVPAPGEDPAVGTDEGAAGGGPGAGTGAGAADGLVDVNAAGSAELQTLPGIGPVLADRIVAWRTQHGPFDSVDALLDVSGIGPAVLGQIRELVRV
ncbi:ComEA family DNA-binding protein [Cellulomonas pakistanensis]|uniref:ComEA family DNA-binding protein n=1 Tax=Cellulomonas pakistanensis TaxID=992287 RepID=UPI0019431439|nr:ComEA family DNA-binding protein [Cellulomonas pakistanensis]